MELLAPNIQHYHWGDYTFIPELQGRPKGDQPEAELWMGAHPTSPSKTLGTKQGLDDIISNDPQKALGVSNSRNELSFIMKILAIREPLSIQVHPTAMMARERYVIQKKRPNSPQLYSSPRSKSEIVCALTETDIKFGFRELSEIKLILDAIGHHEISWIGAEKKEDKNDQILQGLITEILALASGQVQSIISSVLSSDMRSTVVTEKELTYFANLTETYPGDPSLLLFLFMNFITLEPGDFLYIPPGVVHAYLHGNVVEVTSNSDNVIRCGLTPKQVNVQEFLRVADFSFEKPQIQKPTHALHSYESPTPFNLSRLDLNGEWENSLRGPEILISTQNKFTITNALGESLQVDQGQPVWIPYSDKSYTISGDCHVFRCGTSTPNPVQTTPDDVKKVMEDVQTLVERAGRTEDGVIIDYAPFDFLNNGNHEHYPKQEKN